MPSKPVLCDKGHVTIVSSSFPPSPGGSSIVMANLLNYFEPSSLSVLSTQWSNERLKDSKLDIERRVVFKRLGISHRLNLVKEKVEKSTVIRRIVRELKNDSSVAIIAVYPDLFLMSCAMEAAKELKIPLFPYLHDTLVETQSDPAEKQLAKNIQNRLFESAKRIFVMSDGMRSLFNRKYGVDCVSLVHTYPETVTIDHEDSRQERPIMFCGDIYDINAAAVRRVAKACHTIGKKLTISTTKDESYHANLGFDLAHIEIIFFPERVDYLRALANAEILVLALSWPDETEIHADEMSTIFPTKTCEYLSSGSKIFTHCPEDYFLSTFIRGKKCGFSEGSRDENVLAEELKAFSELSSANIFQENARKAARMFSAEKVAPILKAELEEALS